MAISGVVAEEEVQGSFAMEIRAGSASAMGRKSQVGEEEGLLQREAGAMVSLPTPANTICS